jgi:hypothetical protein
VSGVLRTQFLVHPCLLLPDSLCARLTLVGDIRRVDEYLRPTLLRSFYNFRCLTLCAASYAEVKDTSGKQHVTESILNVKLMTTHLVSIPVGKLITNDLPDSLTQLLDRNIDFAS